MPTLGYDCTNAWVTQSAFNTIGTDKCHGSSSDDYDIAEVTSFRASLAALDNHGGRGQVGGAEAAA